MPWELIRSRAGISPGPTHQSSANFVRLPSPLRGFFFFFFVFFILFNLNYGERRGGGRGLCAGGARALARAQLIRRGRISPPPPPPFVFFFFLFAIKFELISNDLSHTRGGTSRFSSFKPCLIFFETRVETIK